MKRSNVYVAVFIIVSPFLTANIRVFCETTKFWEEFLLHAQAVTVASCQL